MTSKLSNSREKGSAQVRTHPAQLTLATGATVARKLQISCNQK